MARFITSLRQAWDIPGAVARKWSNTFYVEAPNAAAAAAVVSLGWQAFLRDAAHERVYAYEVYATSQTEGDALYHILPIAPGNQRGTRAWESLWEAYDRAVCASVTIPVSASRPSRKYWRPGLAEALVSNGDTLNGTLVTAIQTAFDAFLVDAEGALVDPDGQAWQSGVTVRYSRRVMGKESAEGVPTPPPLG